MRVRPARCIPAAPAAPPPPPPPTHTHTHLPVPQSIPVYALEDHNRRLRSLKYTPQHCHCLAAVYGPLAPPNTGVVAIQAAAAGPSPPASWRIAGTGVVLEQEAELRIVKKLKLVGSPLKVAKHSAFVGGLFTSQLEAARFEGAAVTTVSGIRGTIKKALRAGAGDRGASSKHAATHTCVRTFPCQPLASPPAAPACLPAAQQACRACLTAVCA